MAAKQSLRRHVASTVARIAQDDPADPRLAPLRERLDYLAIAEIADWAQRAATALPPLDHAEIAAVARQAARIDGRLTRLAGGDDAA